MNTAKEKNNILLRGIAFLQGCWQEAKLTTWPTPKTAMKQFIIVLLVSAFLTVLLYLSDIFLIWCKKLISI